MKNYYDILGVSEEASVEEIKKKYKELAIRYHPDKNRDPKSQHKFKEISEAYYVLSDYYRRDEYDDMLDREIYGDFNDRFDNQFNGDPLGGDPFNSNPGFSWDTNIEFTEAMKVFDTVFKNDPFFSSNFGSMFNNNKMNDPFQHEFFKNPQQFMDNSSNGNEKSYYKSYSSSSVQTSVPGSDGKVKTEQNVQVSNNGQQANYKEEYYVDKNGRKHVVERRGNPSLKNLTLLNKGGKKTYRLTRK